MTSLKSYYRVNSRVGEWCASLVLICLILSRWQTEQYLQATDRLMLILAAFLTGSSYTARFHIKEHRLLFIMITVTVYLVSGISIGSLVSVVGLVAYQNCLPLLLYYFPGSFTFGESCITLQSTILFIAHAITSLSHALLNYNKPTEAMDCFTIIAQLIFLSEALLFLSPLIPGLAWTNCPTFFYFSSMFVFCGITFPLSMWILQEGPEMFILPYIMNSKFTIQLILFWILLVIIAILIVGQKSGTTSKATTSERKIFHGLIVAVIISGVIVDIEFTYFASLIVLAIFLYLEYIRAFDIRPLSRLLDESFMRFTDEKDQGTLVLTNIYLLVGTFLPLWITYDLTSANKLVMLSGALSVGIGDSAASIVGSCYGYYKWPYSPKKSVDGTIASVVSQVLLLLILAFASVIHHGYVSRAFLPIVITSLIEAHTTQVDNLVLPLTMYILFSAQDLFYPVHL